MRFCERGRKSLAALVTGQLYNTAVHFDRNDLRDAHFHRLLDDEVHLVAFGKPLEEDHADRKLNVGLLYGEQPALDQAVRKRDDLKNMLAAVSVCAPDRNLLSGMHPENVFDMIVVFSAYGEHSVLHGGKICENLGHTARFSLRSE